MERREEDRGRENGWDKYARLCHYYVIVFCIVLHMSSSDLVFLVCKEWSP